MKSNSSINIKKLFSDLLLQERTTISSESDNRVEVHVTSRDHLNSGLLCLLANLCPVQVSTGSEMLEQQPANIDTTETTETVSLLPWAS